MSDFTTQNNNNNKDITECGSVKTPCKISQGLAKGNSLSPVGLKRRETGRAKSDSETGRAKSDQSENGRVKSARSDGDLEESVEILEVIDGRHSSDSVQLEQVFCRSSRERYIAQQLDDYQKKTRNKKVGDTPEEIDRPSVVRYPTSGFYSSVSLDKSHAAQGYHNMISNIDKILKSPTKSEQDTDVVVLSKSKSPSTSSSKLVRKWRRKAATCTRVRPDDTTDDEEEDDDCTTTSKATPIKKKKLDFNQPNAESHSNAENRAKCKIMVASATAECIDLTNEDEDSDDTEDLSTTGGGYYSNVWMSDTTVVEDTDSDVSDVGEAKKLTKFSQQKLQEQYDSDNSEFDEKNWYIDLRGCKRGRSRLRKNGAVSPREVIVLDDSSSGSFQDRSTQTPLDMEITVSKKHTSNDNKQFINPETNCPPCEQTSDNSTLKQNNNLNSEQDSCSEQSNNKQRLTDSTGSTGRLSKHSSSTECEGSGRESVCLSESSNSSEQCGTEQQVEDFQKDIVTVHHRKHSNTVNNNGSDEETENCHVTLSPACQ